MDEQGKHGGGAGGGAAGAGDGAAASKKAKKKGLMRFVVTRGALKRIGVVVVLAVMMVAGAAWYTASMPGESYRGGLPTATAEQQQLAERLRGHVTALAGTVGGRSTYNPRTGAAAAKYLRDHLLESGYGVVNETFVERGSRVPNLEVVLHGSDPSLPCIVVGAHYDTFQGTPGADDNASGCAAVLELARSMMFDAKIKGPMHERSIRFVLFVNEEPPAFQTENMGSWVYAKDLKARGVEVHAMLSIEAIGYYSDTPGSQQYPLKVLERLYPATGDFIGFIGNLDSRWLVRSSIGAFRERAKFPSEGASLPAGIAGVGWSDHWAFWQEGWPAIMVTGTATFRNPNYHTTGDRPETLDYDRMSRVVEGLGAVVHELATAKRWP
jgi:Zn-dependent M28 family amino/carboxypeptidase